MAAVKLKLKDSKTGQESLLLVTKMNLKGVLVLTPHTLPVGRSVRISMQLAGEQLEMNGEVHKIADKERGQQGMILRFVSPARKDLEAIRAYLLERGGSHKVAESQDYSPEQLGGRTVLAAPSPAPAAGKPSTPAKRKSKKDLKITSTIDEELAQENTLNLSEETHYMGDGEMATIGRLKTRSRWRKRIVRMIAVPVVGALLIGIGVLLAPRVGARRAEPTAEPRTEPTAPLAPRTEPPQVPALTEKARPPKPERPTAVPTERPTPAPKIVPELKKITVEDSSGFLKVTFEGPGLGRPEIRRLTNPRRLLAEFRGVQNSSVPPTTPVGVSPLARVRTAKTATGLQVTLDLYPVDFPRYDVKERPGGVALYLHR